MADTPTCDLDGTVLDRTVRPPNVEQVVIRTAAAEYTLVLCTHCKETKSFAEILRAAEGKPGGTAEGAEQMAYLIRR